jgi:hypothetical protein
VYGKDLPQLPAYQKLVQLMQAGVNDYAARADKVASDWGKLNDERQLADLMHDATLRQLDPSKPYVMGDSQSTYRELRERWDKLSPQAQKVYAQARDMYEEHYSQVRSGDPRAHRARRGPVHAEEVGDAHAHGRPVLRARARACTSRWRASASTWWWCAIRMARWRPCRAPKRSARPTRCAAT